MRGLRLKSWAESGRVFPIQEFIVLWWGFEEWFSCCQPSDANSSCCSNVDITIPSWTKTLLLAVVVVVLCFIEGIFSMYYVKITYQLVLINFEIFHPIQLDSKQSLF